MVQLHYLLPSGSTGKFTSLAGLHPGFHLNIVILNLKVPLCYKLLEQYIYLGLLFFI